jgi:hypothetical protein
MDKPPGKIHVFPMQRLDLGNAKAGEKPNGMEG